MKVKELLRQIEVIAKQHTYCEGKSWPCAGLATILAIIKNNPVNVRPAAPPQVEIQKQIVEVPIYTKPPTWTNRDGEEVLIESMTEAHLANTIAFIERTQSERGITALNDLVAEQARRRGGLYRAFVDGREI